MSDNIAQIKERLNVVDIISGYIKVQKAGMNFKARCPFHNEKTPSFYISPERQIWHCFGCQAGGDVFGFVKQIEGIEFPEALRILAQRAGVKLESYDPVLQDAKIVLYEICETATRFFEKQLYHSSVGKKALSYLGDRGLANETIGEFRLGFAPDDWHALSNFLRDCSYRDKDIIDAGLALKREDGSDMYDRFRSRIIFPIADLNDQVVGFTGRTFEAGIKSPASQQPAAISYQQPEAESQKPEAAIAKYINSPQTLIYDKSRILYGLNKAKLEARRADRCLLVEGNTDAIMSYQAGVKNVAATSGTALTPSHLQLLRRYTSNLDFCFDTDQAGLVATRRGLGLGLSQNFNIRIIPLQASDCKDPADYVKKFGLKWQETVTGAKPVIDFYFDKLKSELDLASVSGKKAIVANLAPLIKRLSSEVERAHWISKLAIILKTKEQAIEADIATAKDDLEVYYQPNQPGNQTEKPELPKRPADNLFGEALLAVVVKNPALFRHELVKIKTEFLDPDTISIIQEFGNADMAGFQFNEFVKKFEGDRRLKIEFAHLKAQEILQGFSDEDLKNEFISIKKTLDRRSISVQLASLEPDIKQAEAGNDRAKLTGLLTKFNALTKELNK